MQNIDKIIELIYKAKGSDNSEVQIIANEINALYVDRDNIESVIESEIIRKFGKDFKELSTSSRYKEYYLPRQISMYFLNKHHALPGYYKSFIEISGKFNRKISSVRHACKVINSYLETDKEIRSIINEIEGNINEAI